MSTLEARLRELFEQVDGSDQPPANVSIGTAASRGRSLLRWRRTRLAGAPVLTAAAVIAVALTGVLPTGKAAAPAHRHPAASKGTPVAAAPQRFNPLVPYASLGWLPAGESVSSGATGRIGMFLNAYSGGHMRWQLWVYARGQCVLTTQQVPSGSGTRRSHPVPYLNCYNGGEAWTGIALTGSAPAVNGRRAFWASGSVIWEYARGGWAELRSGNSTGNPGQAALQIARGAEFGTGTPQPILFALQLTMAPAAWQVSSTSFVRRGGALLAEAFSVTSGDAVLPAGGGVEAANLPFFFLGAPRGCYVYPGGRSVLRVVSGYQVVVNDIPGTTGAQSRVPSYQVCAKNADGFQVFIGANGWHPAVTPVTLFEHTRLLGTNPANWTTRPITGRANT